MKGKLLIFSAPSGAGKSTVVSYLLGLDLNLAFSISATSRAPRGNEIHGKEYYFLTTEAFREKIRQDELLEWEEVYPGQYYGTLRSEVTRLREAGKNVLFDIDVMGGINLKKKFGTDALAVFIKPPSLAVLEHRLRTRALDDERALGNRLGKAAREMKFADRFDRILVNDQLEDTFIEAERMVREFLKQ